MVSEQGLNIGCAALWYHLVCVNKAETCCKLTSCNNLQPLFVCCVKTAQFNKIVIYTQRDRNSQIHVNFKFVVLRDYKCFV